MFYVSLVFTYQAGLRKIQIKMTIKMLVTFTRPPPTLVSSCLPSCCRLVAKSRLTLCDPMTCSPPGSSVHGIYLIILSVVKFAEAIRYLTKELTVYSQ